MKLFFLDVVDAGVSNSVDTKLVLVLVATMLAEAIVMLIAKYNNLPKSLLHSVITNIASLIVGYILLKLAPGLFGEYSIANLLVLLLVTIAVELGVLYLLNRSKPFVFTLAVCALMNVITYLLFYLFILLSEK